MNTSEFANSLGVPVHIIRKWEAQKGVLILQSASQGALEAAFKTNKWCVIK